MKPTDIAEILAIFKNNIGGKLPDDFFTWLEILSGDEADILFGEEGENSYSWGMNKTLSKLGFSDDDILKVKIWWSSYPKNYNCDNGTVDPRRKVIQNDDHDTQYADFRGLGDKGCVLSAGCEAEKHRDFEVKLFKDPYDVANNKDDAPIRMILSSFYMNKGVQGLPDGEFYNGIMNGSALLGLGKHLLVMINVRIIVYHILKHIKKMVKLIQEKDFQEFIEMKKLLKLCKNGWK